MKESVFNVKTVEGDIGKELNNQSIRNMEKGAMKINEQYKYFAFISYNSKDTEWGKKVQRKLENYRMPSTLCSERGWERTPIKPVFFAPTDIQPGPLSEELQERLKASRNLIVICSPNSAQSEWVGREIEFFHSIGRTKNIHFFIVEGVPHSGDAKTECFHPIVDTLGLPEILGANIHEKVSRWPWINKERAFVQLISKLLNVEFDSIWQRHKRQMIQKAIVWSFGILMILATIIGVLVTNQPVDVKMSLKEVSVKNDNLPPLSDAIVTIALENETKTDTIRSLDCNAIFNNIPQKFIGRSVHVTVSCEDYMDVDTTLLLVENMILDIRRNPEEFGRIKFDVWDSSGNGVPNVFITIGGYKAVSDKDGHVEFFIPLEEQRKSYYVTLSVPLAKDTIFMPCGENDIIMVK